MPDPAQALSLAVACPTPGPALVPLASVLETTQPVSPAPHATGNGGTHAVPTVSAPRGEPLASSMQLPPCTSNGTASCAVPPHVLGYLQSLKEQTAPILEAPAPRCKREDIPPNFTPRHNGRIMKQDGGLDSEAKAKRVLLRRLGLLEEDEPLSAHILAKYSRLFDRPLTTDVVLAFADFFGWQVPHDLITGYAMGQPLLTTA